MKLSFILISVFIFSSCGKMDRIITGLTGTLTYKCSKHSVEYIQSDSGLSVSYDLNGNVVKCNY